MNEINYSRSIQSLVENYIQGNNPGQFGEGFSLATFEAGNRTYNISCGNAYNGNTPFPLASVSKTLLCALLSNLDIDLNMEIGSFFPSLKTQRSIKILDLINQTSGIGEYLYAASEEDLNRWNLDEYCEFIQTLPVKDNIEYVYSNSNFVLLTKIIEVLTESSYSAQFYTRILEPGNLKNTFSFDEIDSVKTVFAHPHVWKNDKYEKQPITRLIMGYGDSSLFSSVDDLGLLVESPAFKKYVTEVKGSVGKICPTYARGLFCKKIGSTLILSHSGSMPGAMSLLVHIPERNFSLAYLSNYMPVSHEPLIAKLMACFDIL